MKNVGKVFFDEESIYENAKLYLKFVTDGRADARVEGRTSPPKQYAPSTFSKFGALKNAVYMKITGHHARQNCDFSTIIYNVQTCHIRSR